MREVFVHRDKCPLMGTPLDLSNCTCGGQEKAASKRTLSLRELADAELDRDLQKAVTIELSADPGYDRGAWTDIVAFALSVQKQRTLRRAADSLDWLERLRP